MAYKTEWKLEINEKLNQPIPLVLIKEIESYIEEVEDMAWVFSEGINEWGESDRSFNNSDDCMYKLSKLYPQLIFTLKYELVSDTDEGMYTEYWFNGEVQKEELQYVVPPFDINKLTCTTLG